jgi:hypothetical protein
MKIYITKQYNLNMTKLLPFLVVCMLSCSVPKERIADTSFTTIYKNTIGGIENASYQHITNNEAYIKLIEALKIDESEYSKLVAVNFKEKDVLVLYQGNMNTGGYSIDVANIRWENEVLFIQKLEIVPESGKAVTLARTAPYCIVVIPKAKKISIVE